MAGHILYAGPSQIDGAPIVVVLIVSSANRKTGNMAQTYILRSDMHPVEALGTGADVAICGACPHRPQWRSEGKYGRRSCYVDINGPSAVYRAYVAGKYPVASDLVTLGAGRLIRLGTYGDPAAVPVHVWDSLLASASGWTGYSHQWRAPRLRGVMRYCQASCDSDADVVKAHALGFRTFTVRAAGNVTPPDASAILCPASAEAGKLATCATCRLCDGRTQDVFIPAHGIGADLVTGDGTKHDATTPAWRAKTLATAQGRRAQLPLFIGA
jgi:hypothetical protein